MRLFRWFISLLRNHKPVHKNSDLIESGVYYQIFREAGGTAYIVVPDRRESCQFISGRS